MDKIKCELVKPTCKLIGSVGDDCYFIAQVSMALKRAGEHRMASEFECKALTTKDKEELVKVIFEYVDVT